MEERKRANINIIQNITLIVIILVLGSVFLMDKAKYINIKPVFGFVALGSIFLPLGIFGYLKKEILFTKAKSLEYSEHSVLGKIVNVIICILGFVSIVFGIINSII